MHSNEHVLESRHLLEEADVLKRAADAALGDRMWRPTGDVLAVELDQPARRFVHAGEHVEERRLAGAVRTDQAHRRIAGDREVDVVDGE